MTAWKKRYWEKNKKGGKKKGENNRNKNGVKHIKTTLFYMNSGRIRFHTFKKKPLKPT